MTPGDLDLIERDAALLAGAADAFSHEFYATLFELEPAVRPMFPEDLVEQRRKLLDELGVLVERATAIATGAPVDRFVDRARELGERHELYGVTAPMYRLVELALLAGLRHVVDDFDDDHERAWTRLHRLVAAAMQSS